jgi:predicted anti-sigma-YlaC factor YlaD
MNCENFKERLSAMLDGELASSDALSAHEASCPDCRTFHEQLILLNNTLGNLPHPTPSHDLAARVKDRLTRGNSRQRELVWRKLPVFAMVVLLAIGLGNLAGRSISELYMQNPLASSLDLIAPDQGNSLSDMLAEFGSEENSQ